MDGLGLSRALFGWPVNTGAVLRLRGAKLAKSVSKTAATRVMYLSESKPNTDDRPLLRLVMWHRAFKAAHWHYM